MILYKNESASVFNQQVGDDMVTCEPGATVMLPEAFAALLKPLGLVIVTEAPPADPAPDKKGRKG